MRHLLKIVSILALIVTMIPSFLYLAGRGELATIKLVMLIATAVWFITAPFAWQRGDDDKPLHETQAQP